MGKQIKKPHEAVHDPRRPGRGGSQTSSAGQESEGKSLNEVALNVFTEAAGMENGKRVYHDLDQLIGTWVEDPAVEETLAAQRVVDEEMWR